MNYVEVADTLERFADGTGGSWDWDVYISGTSFNDVYLCEMQRRMDGLSREFPPTERGWYCSAEGIAVIRQYIIELRHRGRQIHPAR